MNNELLQSIGYIAIIFGIWLAGFTGFTLYHYITKHYKYLWMFSLGITIVFSLMVFGFEGYLISLL